jgi:predicted aldo/keto reductase-like oxidoreductase
VEDNIKTFTSFKKLTKEEHTLLTKVVSTYRSLNAIPCTGCKYCMPCPKGIDIPRCFDIANTFKKLDSEFQLHNGMKSLSASQMPSNCVNCKQCMKKCPQKIQIPTLLTTVSELFSSHPLDD